MPWQRNLGAPYYFIPQFPRSLRDNTGKSPEKNTGVFFLLFIDQFSISLTNEFYTIFSFFIILHIAESIY